MLIIKVNDERKNKTMKRKKKKMKLLKIFLFRFSCFEKIELKETTRRKNSSIFFTIESLILLLFNLFSFVFSDFLKEILNLKEKDLFCNTFCNL